METWHLGPAQKIKPEGSITSVAAWRNASGCLRPLGRLAGRVSAQRSGSPKADGSAPAAPADRGLGRLVGCAARTGEHGGRRRPQAAAQRLELIPAAVFFVVGIRTLLNLVQELLCCSEDALLGSSLCRVNWWQL